MKARISCLVLLVVCLMFPRAASADVAPPEEPPGANIVPQTVPTQVRMQAETVILDVLGDDSGQAAVTATFTMLNLGEGSETLLVRFPLSFWNGESDGWGNYPEISDLRVKVDGSVVTTRRILSTNPPVPSAAFEVTFPPDQPVAIEVKYTATATREFEGGPPYLAFAYVLETGAGWQDTIGSVDLIVRLPYEAHPHNVILAEGVTGFASTTAGAVLSGTEVRWHYEDLEPTWEHNMEIALLEPAHWRRILLERENVTRQPEDGEAWGRLGKLYKEASQTRKGMRTDPAAEELFQLSVAAYEKAVTLLPEDALWHAGYGDLLARYYTERQYMGLSEDWGDLKKGFEELQLAYTLDPGNAQILEILGELKYFVPGLQQNEDGSYTFIFLTTTPTPWIRATATSQATPAAAATGTRTAPEPAPTEPVQVAEDPAGGAQDPASGENQEPFLPFCGLGFLLLPLGLVLAHRARRRSLYT